MTARWAASTRPSSVPPEHVRMFASDIIRRGDLAKAVVPRHLHQRENLLDARDRSSVVAEQLNDARPDRGEPFTASDRHESMFSDEGDTACATVRESSRGIMLRDPLLVPSTPTGVTSTPKATPSGQRGHRPPRAPHRASRNPPAPTPTDTTSPTNPTSRLLSSDLRNRSANSNTPAIPRTSTPTTTAISLTDGDCLSARGRQQRPT